MKRYDSIRVLLADDHATMRQGLAMYLESVNDLELVGQASNGEEALQLCATVQPDVVVMDLDMPKLDGIEATKVIQAKHPDIQVLALTSFNDIDRVQASLKAGAAGYILKTTSLDDLADAIRSVYQGNVMLSAEATETLVNSVKQPPKESYNLTEREIEVLGYLVEGLTNVAIAEQLSLSPFTIKAYVSDILSKLGVSNRSEAVAFTLKNKLLD